MMIEEGKKGRQRRSLIEDEEDKDDERLQLILLPVCRFFSKTSKKRKIGKVL